MSSDERNVVVATIGLAITALGAFLPWARIGGRSRSGFSTADTFIALANGALPDAIAWIGRWWYLPAFLAFIAWASTFLAGHWAMRTLGLSFVVVGAAMWWLFVWAANNYNLLAVRTIGPVVATAGLSAIGFACSRNRRSLLRPKQASAQA